MPLIRGRWEARSHLDRRLPEGSAMGASICRSVPRRTAGEPAARPSRGRRRGPRSRPARRCPRPWPRPGTAPRRDLRASPVAGCGPAAPHVRIRRARERPLAGIGISRQASRGISGAGCGLWTMPDPVLGAAVSPRRPTPAPPQPEVLAAGLSAMARDLEHQDDPVVMLAEIVAAAVAMVPGADEGSISFVTGRRQVTSEAPTGDLPVRVDALQYETSAGTVSGRRL